MATPRPYVGLDFTGRREVFRSDVAPAGRTHPKFLGFVGPFRTMRAACYMATDGWNNPLVQSVADAERIAGHKGLS